MKRNKRHEVGHAFCGPKFWSMMVLIVMALLVVFCIQQFTNPPPTTPSSYERELKPLPLSQFPTLNKAFAQADMVGLYFAASWCSMSTGPTKLLGDIFGDLLESQPSKFAIVYVSSDKNQESMEAYMKPNWIGVPYDSEERTALKKHFSVCAQIEMGDLGIDRKYEIPSLFIFDAQSHGLITTHGVQDLQEHGSLEVFELWKGTQNVVRGLSEKYIDE